MAEQGFAAPVFDAQRVFRAVLSALGEPGRVLAVDPCCAPPEGMDPAAAAVVLALCDGDTPLWLAPRMAAAAGFFRFHAGAAIVPRPADALFLVADAAERPPLAALSPGTPEYPDRSATLVLVVGSLDEGRGWLLSGPGITGSRRFLPQPVDDRLLGECKENQARFPLGVDILFTARNRVAGLPRSTRVEA
jgi:alpha-D-ribose 1-methylphosphonate 5-triphosphate synthase subunit PhnH